MIIFFVFGSQKKSSRPDNLISGERTLTGLDRIFRQSKWRHVGSQIYTISFSFLWETETMSNGRTMAEQWQALVLSRHFLCLPNFLGGNMPFEKGSKKLVRWRISARSACKTPYFSRDSSFQHVSQNLDMKVQSVLSYLSKLRKRNSLRSKGIEFSCCSHVLRRFPKEKKNSS